jgi:PAS domain-containing protein
VRASTAHIGPRILATLETLTADDTGRYIAANDAVCNLTGYAQEELLYMSIWDSSPELDVKTIRRAGGFDGEYQLWRATGEPIEIRCIAAADVIPGLHVATMASCRRSRLCVPHTPSSDDRRSDMAAPKMPRAKRRTVH